MSNILIIKLGSLGDVVQVSGALKDIRKHHKNEKIFYRKFIFNINDWSSSKDIPQNKYNNSVLQRFDEQLRKSNIQTRYTLKPDFSWAAENGNYYNLDTNKKYILFFPFCSKDLIHKRWPYFSELINLIKQNHPEFELVVAPGPDEIVDAKSFNIKIALNNNSALNFFELASLIKKSHLVIANDTGPAHMTAHLGAKGFVLFGSHTTPEKVSIERENFIAIKSINLKLLSYENVYSIIKNSIN